MIEQGGAPGRAGIRGVYLWLALLSKGLDMLIIGSGLYLSVAALRPDAWSTEFAAVGLLGAVIFSLAAEVLGVYQHWPRRSVRDEADRVILAWLMMIFVLVLLGYFLKVSMAYSRLSIGFWILLTPPLLLLWRRGANRSILRLASGKGLRLRAAVWGEGEQGRMIREVLARDRRPDIQLVDYIEHKVCADDGAEQIESRLQSLVDRARDGKLDLIYIAVSASSRARIVELIDSLSDTPASVYVVPDFFTAQLLHAEWGSVGGVPVVSVFDSPFWGLEGGVKRAQDVLLSLIILLLAAFPMLLIALAVAWSSPGPVVFRQRRYGMDGREIRVLKFRTMYSVEDGEEIRQATRGDSRITPVGSLLRRTSLDELPQFFNVLRGEMSIVGPRPHAVAHNEKYRALIKGYMLRHRVKPGITGWAQVNGWRGETETLEKMEKRIEFDLWYIRNWTLWLDFKIIFLTIPQIFRSGYAG